MRKVIVIILVIIVLISATIFYLNKFVLPNKAKALIIRAIEENTQKKVSLKTVEIDIFRGLVLKNLNLYDNNKIVVSLKQASCGILILPLINKKIIIPEINLDYPQVLLERNKSQPKPEGGLAIGTASKSVDSKQQPKGFELIVYRVNVNHGTVFFKDNTLDVPFVTSLKDISLKLNLALPSSVKFKLKAQIAGNPIAGINALGEFKIPQQELLSEITFQNLSLKMFSSYYGNTGLVLKDGLIGGLIKLKLKDNIILLDTQVRTKDFSVLRDKLSMDINTDVKANIEYSLNDNQIKYSGKAGIKDSVIKGIDIIDEISGINGQINFDNFGLSADKINAIALGLPITAVLSLKDFSNPAFNLRASSNPSFKQIKNILYEKFKYSLPADINGDSKFTVELIMDPKSKKPVRLEGYLDIINATLKLEKVDNPITGINGRISLNDESRVKVSLLSKDISIESSADILDKEIILKGLKISYLNSEVIASGAIATKGSPLGISLDGSLILELADLEKFLPQKREEIAKIKPNGKVHLKFNFLGDRENFKNYELNINATSPKISLYGLKGQDLFIDYAQVNGLINIPSLRLSLYSGLVNASFKANLNSANQPYHLEAQMQDVLIEELKLDTQAKDKDIAGVIQGKIKTDGFLKNILESGGQGYLAITKGKLWELDLFKGLGKLLFSKDFSNIVFNEGSCSFTLKDKFISSDDFTLKSNIVDLSGPVRIGFDESINAALDINIINELIPLNGTFKDVTTFVIGKSGKFATIHITGTVKEPNYKLKADVTNIIKGLTDMFLKKN